MKRLVATVVLANIVGLAACSSATGPATVPAGRASDGFVPLSTTATGHRVTYRFASSHDNGVSPYTSLIDVKGILYGTTQFGGTRSCSNGKVLLGCGTVFDVSETGAEAVLHRFGSAKDGSWPQAGLTGVNGTLYGTTGNGGANGQGTVFSVTTSGTEQVVHSFGSQADDGAGPYAGLIAAKGTLYGTTSDGGAHGFGTVFSVHPTTGAEHVLYSFKGGRDGGTPLATLIEVHGTLYGTTNTGGGTGCAGKVGCGTVYSVSATTGVEHVLHRFGKGTDGAVPYASLIEVNGKLYGTTARGGTSPACPGGCGTVFSVSTTSSAEHALYDFKGGADGTFPVGGLVDVDGELYGTTAGGGTFGKGTFFGITTSGNETVLHTFGKGSDGSDPQANLLYVNGLLYGTTLQGGDYCLTSQGCGTVFSVTTRGKEAVLYSFGEAYSPPLH